MTKVSEFEAHPSTILRAIAKQVLCHILSYSKSLKWKLVGLMLPLGSCG